MFELHITPRQRESGGQCDVREVLEAILDGLKEEVKKQVNFGVLCYVVIVVVVQSADKLVLCTSESDLPRESSFWVSADGCGREGPGRVCLPPVAVSRLASQRGERSQFRLRRVRNRAACRGEESRGRSKSRLKSSREGGFFGLRVREGSYLF